MSVWPSAVRLRAVRSELERRRRGLAAGVLLLLAGGCAVMHPRGDELPSASRVPAGEPVAALPRHGIELLVWNVKKAQRAAWPGEFAALVADKELVLLQEAYTAPRMTQSLAVRSELEWLMAPSFAFAWRRGAPATGVVVGSTARARWHQGFVTLAAEPLLRTPKAAIAATYAVEGAAEPLLVVCVHGINFRRAQALEAQLRALEPVIRAHRGPVILAGDLNTHHRARMEVVEEFAARLGLRSVFDNRRGARSKTDGRTRYEGWPLDHVYVRGLVVEAARVVEGTHGSDHEPMIVRVSSE